jgi:hypothetical protein
MIAVVLAGGWVAISAEPVPPVATVAAAAGAGLSMTVGLAAFFQAMVVGTMSVVAPISARSWETDPKIRPTRLAIHLTSSVAPSRPSKFSAASDVGVHSVRSSSTCTKKSLVSDSVLRELRDEPDDLEALYQDIHGHPEVSLQEKRTAGRAAEGLKASGFEATEGAAEPV